MMPRMNGWNFRTAQLQDPSLAMPGMNVRPFHVIKLTMSSS